MAFTNQYKRTVGQYGILSYVGMSSADNTEEILDWRGNPKYISPNCPVLQGQPTNLFDFVGTYNSSDPNGWLFSKNTVVNGCFTYQSFIPAAKTSVSFSNGKAILRCTVSNNTSSDVQIASIGYIGLLYCATSSGGSSTSTSKFVFMYENLDTPITVLANDSVIIDIILENGDVRSVNVVENR